MVGAKVYKTDATGRRTLFGVVSPVRFTDALDSPVRLLVIDPETAAAAQGLGFEAPSNVVLR